MKDAWCMTSVGQVCEIVNGGTPKTGVANYWGGSNLWITPAEMGKRASPYVDETARTLTSLGLLDSSARLLPPFSVILSSRAPIGHLVINRKPMATNQGCKGLVPGKMLDHKFLFYYLGSIVELLNDLGTGTTFKEISGGKLKDVPLPLPPLPEQKYIVAILDEASKGINTAIANSEKNLANARELFKTYQDTVFSSAQNGWVTSPLGECLHLITYGFTNPMPTTDSGPFMVTARNVVGGKIDYSGARHTSRDAFKVLLSEKSRPQMGDLLLTKDGTLGRVAVVDQLDICVNQSVAVLRPNERMNVNFMRRLLESSHYQQRMIADAGGTTIKHIYITRVDKMLLTYPKNIDEQEAIVNRLEQFGSKTDILNDLYQQRLSNLVDLRTSILQKAFAGELTTRSAAAALEAAE